MTNLAKNTLEGKNLSFQTFFIFLIFKKKTFSIFSELFVTFDNKILFS